jgi:hypothetical protein
MHIDCRLNTKGFESKVKCLKKLLDLLVKFKFKFGKSLKCSICYFYHDYIMLEWFLGRMKKCLDWKLCAKAFQQCLRES